MFDLLSHDRGGVKLNVLDVLDVLDVQDVQDVQLDRGEVEMSEVGREINYGTNGEMMMINEEWRFKKPND